MYIATNHYVVRFAIFWRLLGDCSPVSVCKAFGGVFLTPYFKCGNGSSTGNRYANVSLHPGLHYGFGGARARCQEMWTAGFKRVPHEGGWEFRLH